MAGIPTKHSRNKEMGIAALNPSYLRYLLLVPLP